MAKTRADKEGWKPKDREYIEDILIPEVIDDPVEAVKKLKPIEGLNFDRFIDELVANMQDTEKYSRTISSLFGRMKLNRQFRHVQLFQQYLNQAREASNSAAELQATLLKNKIIFQFQAEIAIIRVKEEWTLEQKGRDIQIETLDMEIAHKRFMKRFYDTADPNQLSETALMLLNLMQPIRIQKTSHSFSGMEGSGSSENSEYGSIEGMQRIKQQDRMMEVLMKEMSLELGEKKAEVRKTTAQARREEAQADTDEWEAQENKKSKK